jgi:hypothetical protein
MTTIDPTVTSLPQLRLNAVCPYYTMYPLAFPYGELADAQPKDIILDPFCGRGTTLFAARLRGLDVVGIDLNPVAVAIAQAKLASTTVGRVMKLVDELLVANTDTDVPEGRFWTLAFEAQTLREVAALRAGLLTAGEGHTAALLRAVFIGALHGPRNKGEPSYLSNQMPRSYATKPRPAIRFWEKNELLPKRVNIRELLRRRVTRILESVIPPVSGRVILGDARTALRGTQRRYARVITSPPYLGMRTYLPDQWLRHWSIGGPADPTYALPGQISSQRPESFASELAEVWTAVGQRCEVGARMTIRFGALPSVPVEPSDVIAESLRKAKGAWRILDERPAGMARDGRRQADQFGRESSEPITEVDIVAVLDR